MPAPSASARLTEAASPPGTHSWERSSGTPSTLRTDRA